MNFALQKEDELSPVRKIGKRQTCIEKDPMAEMETIASIETLNDIPYYLK